MLFLFFNMFSSVKIFVFLALFSSTEWIPENCLFQFVFFVNKSLLMTACPLASFISDWVFARILGTTMKLQKLTAEIFRTANEERKIGKLNIHKAHCRQNSSKKEQVTCLIILLWRAKSWKTSHIEGDYFGISLIYFSFLSELQRLRIIITIYKFIR